MTAPQNSYAQFSDFFKKLKETFTGKSDQTLADDKIIDGLKEALKVGSENALAFLSQEGSYFYNPQIKIGLPESLNKIESVIRSAGFGSYVDDFELSMNRAAEKAAPAAKKIIFDALKEMTFSDAKKILNGKANEATIYFKEKSYAKLMEIFRPLVNSSMSQAGVTNKYLEIESMITKIPFIESLPGNFNLDNYVTEKALDGIFLMLEKEEKKIRENPSARVTDLLREVFGGNN